MGGKKIRPTADADELSSTGLPSPAPWSDEQGLLGQLPPDNAQTLGGMAGALTRPPNIETTMVAVIGGELSVKKRKGVAPQLRVGEPGGES